MTLLLLVLAFAISAVTSSHFLDAGYLLDATSLYMEIGVMALAMTLVIISGNIDLSAAAGLSRWICVTAAKMYSAFLTCLWDG